MSFISPITDSEWLYFKQAGAGAVTRSVQSKLRDVVSVKDFGAVGDGVTDDTAAITNALAAADVVFLPAGIYKVSQIVITGSGNSAVFGKTLRGAGLGATTIVGYTGGTSIIRFGTAGGWVDEPNLQEYKATFCGLEDLTINASANYTYGVECQWMTDSSWRNVAISAGGLGGSFTGAALYIDFSWDNDFVHTYLVANNGLKMGSHSPNRNSFHGMRVSGGVANTGIGVDFSGSANSFFGLDASLFAVGVASTFGGHGLSIQGGYFESNEVDISLGGSSIQGVTVTGSHFIAGLGSNIAIQHNGSSSNVRGFLISGNSFTDKTVCVQPTANTQEWVFHGNTFINCPTIVNPIGTGGNYHVFENYEYSFTPVFTNLVTTGSPLYSGKYFRMGKTIRFIVVIDDNGGTTASTAGSTYFTGLPTAVAEGGGLSAVDGGINDLGNGLVSSIYAFTPTWGANGNQIIISGSYTVA